MSSKRPNIVFMFSDQQRFDTLGCYGQKLPVTPNLDRLAREGTKFNFAFTCQPVCGPARACLQTGKYAAELNCFVNAMPLPKDTRTIAECFNDAGYDTAYVGKWHLASDNEHNYKDSPVPEERRGGYKYWMASDVLEFTSHGYNGHVFDNENKQHDFVGFRADCIQEFALDYIRNRDKNSNRPFFLFISHIEPHHQNDHKIYEGPDGSKEKWKDFEVPGDLIGTGGNWKENYPDYLGACNALDNNVGKLMDTLKTYGYLENTIFIYTSDHGTHFKTRNPEYKRSCHESSIRVPMIAYGPGFMGGKVINDLASLIDIPTLLDCAEIEKPDGFRGNSLLKLAKGEAENWPDAVFLQISENHIGRAVRTDKWTYSVRALGDAGTQKDADVYYDYLLYDLENDYYQKNNLIGKPGYENITASLRQILKEKMAEAGEEMPEILPNTMAPEEWHQFNEFTPSKRKAI
ncbi:MAG: sulfatase-like hydrolase/transferase [Bacillota bacterium]|nr:sulfatase-like hydrolase/transferase [Bacillota bacterium]